MKIIGKKRGAKREIIMKRRLFAIVTLVLTCILIALTVNLVFLLKENGYLKSKYSEFLLKYNIERENTEIIKRVNEINTLVIDPKYKWQGEVLRNNKPNKLIIHHSGTESSDILKVHEYHKERGWTGIGYHYYIKKDGSIYKGRDEDMEGSHTVGQNSSSIGVCLEGNFEEEKIGDEQLNSLYNIGRDVVARYNIDKIEGHRDNANTLCPGKNIEIEKIKEGIYKKILELN